MMRHSPGEDDAGAEVQLVNEGAQIVIFRPAAGEQHGDGRLLPPHFGYGAQQQIQTLIGIERAKKAEDGLPVNPEPGCQSMVWYPWPAEHAAINGVGYDRDLVIGHTAGDNVRSQPLTDRCHCIGAVECASLNDPRRDVAQSGGLRPVARRRVS